MSRYDTVERTQHSESDLALTKDEGGIIRYIGDTAVQSPAILLRGQTRPGQDRGASFGRDSSLPVRDSIQLQVKDTQESAKSSALILNAKRLSLDVSMWAMGDIYDIQHLKSYAVSQLNTRLLALQKYGSPPSLILDIIHPIYECTTGKKKDLRVMLVQALRRFKKAIGMDPLLRSHFDALTKSNNDLMTDLVDDWLDIP